MSEEKLIKESVKAAARTWFEFNDLPLTEVAKRFNINERTLQHWANKEGWIRNCQTEALRAQALKTRAFSASGEVKNAVAALVEEMPNSNLIPNDIKEELITTKFASVLGGAHIKSEMTLALMTLKNALLFADAKGDAKATSKAALDYFEALNKFNAAIFGTTTNLNVTAAATRVENLSDEELAQLIEEEN